MDICNGYFWEAQIDGGETNFPCNIVLFPYFAELGELKRVFLGYIVFFLSLPLFPKMFLVGIH
jgi:hypothetical protein